VSGSDNVSPDSGVCVGREHDIHSGNLSCDFDVFVGSECDIHRHSEGNYLRRI
jgi:hypothetical protein